MRISDWSSDVCSSDLNDDITSSDLTADEVMDALAKALNAHDDLSDSIKDFSSKNESEILDQISRSEDVLRRVQAEAGNDDAILRVARPNGTTNTPWPRAMRRMANSALLPRPNIDHSRPLGRAHVCTPVTNAHLVCR